MIEITVREIIPANLNTKYYDFHNHILSHCILQQFLFTFDFVVVFFIQVIFTGLQLKQMSGVRLCSCVSSNST